MMRFFLQRNTEKIHHDLSDSVPNPYVYPKPGQGLLRGRLLGPPEHLHF